MESNDVQLVHEKVYKHHYDLGLCVTKRILYENVFKMLNLSVR